MSFKYDLILEISLLNPIYAISGGYETGHAEYKHFYFNCNRNTLMIWSITVVALLGLYEGVKAILTTIFYGRQNQVLNNYVS